LSGDVTRSFRLHDITINFDTVLLMSSFRFADMFVQFLVLNLPLGPNFKTALVLFDRHEK